MAMEHTYLCTGHAARLPDILRAENCRLWTGDGRRFIDLESGVWAASLGHGDPELLAALSRQGGALMHTGYAFYHPVVDEAAARVLDICGLQGGKALFLSSGSEAVEFCLQLLRAARPGKKLLCFSDSYLGAYGLASRADPEVWISLDWTSEPELGALDWEDIGAFVLEPGSSGGLVRFPPEALVRDIVARIRAAGGYVVANEVTTGMGRTGAWFGYEHYGISPDLVAIGKGLGSGYPVSAVALGGPLARLNPPGFHYAQSHQNDALGAAAAKTVIEAVAERNLLAKVRADGAYLLGRLRDIAEGSGRVKEVRGRGLMLAIEFREASGPSRAQRVADLLFEQGYLLVRRPGLEVLRLDPPLTIPREDLDGFLGAFEDSLSRLD